jgi:hypothetical protein
VLLEGITCFVLKLYLFAPLGFTLSQTYLYHMDERVAPENLEIGGEKYVLPPPINLISFTDSPTFSVFLSLVEFQT